MPSIKVHQCRDIYPKLSVLKQHDQICKFKKNAFCNVCFLNLAKDYKSETRMPFMNVHQCRDIYPKLSVLKCCGNFCCFSTFLTTPIKYVVHNMQSCLKVKNKGHALVEKAGASHPFISHFRLKQLNLKTDLVHIDRLATLL